MVGILEAIKELFEVRAFTLFLMFFTGALISSGYFGQVLSIVERALRIK